MGHPDVREIVKIDGTMNGGFHTFKKDIDYKLNGTNVDWLRDGEKPDEHTPFFVNYRLDVHQGITDINPGSVTRTIVESVALEMDFLYAQMDRVYYSAFIDTATGKSLELVASLLGINRKMAGFATGEVKFGRESDPGEVEVLRETHIFDGKGTYSLKNQYVKNIKKIEGTSKGILLVFTPEKDYTVSDGSIIWIKNARQPDDGSVFYADYTAYEQIIIPIDTRVSNYSRKPENLKIFRTLRETSLVKNSSGKWEAIVPVTALSPGRQGNIFAGTLTVMPKPVIGVEYIINQGDILNGTDPESDSDLRERAKHALEMAGKGTLASLKSAVRGIEGVSGEVKVVDQPDGIPGIVQVIASGGDEKEIEKVIEETRSAGIKVEFKRPSIVHLDIKLTIVIIEGINHDEVRKEVDETIRKYVATLNIDDDVILSQIVKSALIVKGIRDVRDVTINDKKENVVIKTDERSELRTLEIYIGD